MSEFLPGYYSRIKAENEGQNLIVRIYRSGDIGKGLTSPAVTVRFSDSPKRDRTEIIDGAGKKSSKATLAHLEENGMELFPTVTDLAGNTYPLYFMDNDTVDMISGFFGCAPGSKEIKKAMFDFQDEVRKIEQEKRKSAANKKQKEVNGFYRPVSKKIRKWSIDRMPDYGFYTKTRNGKSTEVYCTHCQKRVSTQIKVKHGEAEKCPSCRKTIKWYAEGKAKTWIQDTNMFAFIDNAPEKADFTIRYLLITRTICRKKDPMIKTDISEVMRSVFKNGKPERSLLTTRNGIRMLWPDPLNGEQGPCYGYFQKTRGIKLYGDAYIYPDTKYLKGSVFERSGIGDALTHADNKCHVLPFERMLENYLLNPEVVEKLAKSGLPEISMQAFTTEIKDCINPQATRLREILMVDGAALNFVREHDLNVRELILYRKLRKAGHSFGIEELRFFNEGSNAAVDTIIGIKKPHLRKLRAYLEKQAWLGGTEARISYYANCITMLRDLECSDEEHFPKDLRAFHDRIVSETSLHKDEITMRKEKVKNDSCTEVLKLYRDALVGCGLRMTGSVADLGDKNFVFVLPERGEDLVNESNVLCHCVKSYRSKIIDKTTMILFVRRKEAPETPLYTMEWWGRTVQIRGKKNCNASKEAELFQKKIEKRFLDLGVTKELLMHSGEAMERIA